MRGGGGVGGGGGSGDGGSLGGAGPPLGFSPAGAPRGYAGFPRSNRVAPYASPAAAEAAAGGGGGGGGDGEAAQPHPAAAGGGSGGGSAWVPSSMSPLGPRAMYLRSLPSPRPADAGRPLQLQQPPALQYLPLQHPLQHFQQQHGLSDSLLRKGSQESLASSGEGPAAHASGGEPEASADSPRRNVSWADERGFDLEEVRRAAARAHAALPSTPLPPLPPIPARALTHAHTPPLAGALRGAPAPLQGAPRGGGGRPLRPLL